jgi:hypothetical protein
MVTITLYDITYPPTGVTAVEDCDYNWIYWDAPVPGKGNSGASKMKEGGMVYTPDTDRGGEKAVVGYKVWRIAAGDEGNPALWGLLTTNPIPGVTEYYDYSWTNAPQGAYRYAVKTVYSGGAESNPALSNMVNKLVAPGDLQVELDECSALLKWSNEPPAGFEPFFDDVEKYENFIIDNIGDYTLRDLDGSATYGFNGISFPNAYYTGSYIVFNPFATSPPMTDTEGIQPYSGQKFFGCFAATDLANNDWLILPKIGIADGVVFSFWAKTYMPDYGLERIKIGVSTTGTNAPGDFTIISTGNYIQVPATGWTQYTFNLSAYASQEVHLAINCVSDDAFILMIDDISVAIPGKSRDAEKCFNGYTLYLDGVVKATGVMEEEYLFTNLPAGDYVAGVQAVYTYGATEIVTFPFTVACPPPTYKVTFIVSDETHQLVEGATIQFNGETLPGYEAGDVAPGTYDYTVTKEEYHATSGSVIVVNKDVIVPVTIIKIGIDDNDLDYNIYPNPTNNHLVVSRINAGFATIDIYNAMGMHIATYETAEMKYEINVSTLSAGTYFIRVTEGDNSSVKSFVKK